MAKDLDKASFEKIVEWACSTLPEEIRSLPDFPGIQIIDEPTAGTALSLGTRGTELLGCFKGISRTQRSFNSISVTPDVICVFRGPILRYSKGNLPAEVKQVVWHEVAHWLGESEEQVKELGLSVPFKELVPDPLEAEAVKKLLQESAPDTAPEAEDVVHELRCIKCYSTEVICREYDRPLNASGRWLADPMYVHVMSYKCSLCGYEWEDEQD